MEEGENLVTVIIINTIVVTMMIISQMSIMAMETTVGMGDRMMMMSMIAVVVVKIIATMQHQSSHPPRGPAWIVQ
jgi:hypothetical protein